MFTKDEIDRIIGKENIPKGYAWCSFGIHYAPIREFTTRKNGTQTYQYCNSCRHKRRHNDLVNREMNRESSKRSILRKKCRQQNLPPPIFPEENNKATALARLIAQGVQIEIPRLQVPLYDDLYLVQPLLYPQWTQTFRVYQDLGPRYFDRSKGGPTWTWWWIQGKHCAYCSRLLLDFGDVFGEHIVPYAEVTMTGATVWNNCAAACRKCNYLKMRTDPRYFFWDNPKRLRHFLRYHGTLEEAWFDEMLEVFTQRIQGD